MIEPTGAPGMRATAEPAREDSAEQTNGLAFQHALERRQDSARSKAKPAPEERNKGDIQPGEALDPTSRAAAELATAAPAKATTAAALKEQSAPGAAAATTAQPRPAANSAPRVSSQSPTSAQNSPPSAAASRATASATHAPAAGAQAAAAQRGPAQHAGRATPLVKPSPAVSSATPSAATTARAAIPATSSKSAAAAPTPTTAARPQPAAPSAKLDTSKPPRTADPAPRNSDEAPPAQFSRGLAAALRQNGGTVTLHLKPQELGDLKIRLQIHQGSVEARFEAATDQARGLLNESIDSLRAALEAKGLEVDRLSVHVAERPPEHEAQDAPPRDSGDSGQGHGRYGREGHGAPRSAARTPQPDSGGELLEIPEAWAESYAGLGGALRLDAIA